MACGAGPVEDLATVNNTIFMRKADAEQFFPGCQYAVRDAYVYSLASLIYHHADKASILELYTFYCQCPMVAYRAPHPRTSAASTARQAELRQLERSYPGLRPPARGGGNPHL